MLLVRGRWKVPSVTRRIDCQQEEMRYTEVNYRSYSAMGPRVRRKDQVQNWD